MFITIEKSKIGTARAVYILQNEKSHVFFVGQTLLTELGNFKGLENATDQDHRITLVVLRLIEDGDELAAINHALWWCDDNNRSDLRPAVIDAMKKPRSKRVMCIETGQQWESVNAAALECAVTYSQLHGHLNGRVGFKSVKGKTYRYV